MAHPFGNTSPNNPRTSALRAEVRRGLARHKRRSSGLLANLPSGAMPRPGPAHKILFEPLEPRLLLSADLMPLHVDMGDADIGDDITLRLDSTSSMLEVYRTSNPATGPLVSQKLNETSKVVIHGADNRDDTLTVDFAAPFFIDIDYDGGAGGFDSLVLQGGDFDSANYNAQGPDSGSIDLRDGASSATIVYAGLEPITDNNVVANRVFDITANDQRIVLSNDVLNDGFSLIDSQGTESVSFANPTAALTVNALGGSNTFVLEQLDPGFSATISLNGSAGSDTIEVVRDADFSLNDSGITIGTQSASLTGIEVADLTGGVSGNAFNVTGWTGAATLSGLGGDDSYVFGDNFGNTTIVGSSGTDTLDMAAVTGALTVSRTGALDNDTITAGTDTVTQTGEIAERFDYILSANRLETALGDLQDFVTELQAAGGDLQALVNQVPLLDRIADGGIADLVQLIGSVTEFVGDAQDAITNQGTLEALVSVINGLLLDAGAASDTLTINATSGYQAGQLGELELLIGLQLDANRIRDDIALDFGIDAGNRDIGVEGTLSVDALLDIDLTLGFTTTVPDEAFLLEGGTFGLELTAATATLTKVNLGFLELDVATGSASLDGRVDATLVDPDVDNRVALNADPGTVTSVVVTDPGTPGFFNSSISLTPIPIETIDLGGGPIANAIFALSLPAGKNPFGDVSGNVEPVIDISAIGPSGAPVDLLDFSNITPSEILGMLGEVADLLGSIGGSQFLEIGIPFTELDLGDILDFGGSFKETILDPLFTSGDSLRPDNNEDGQIDASDITFSSIQGLLDRLEDILDPNDILGVDLTALYDSGVHVSTPDPGQAVTATQIITVNNAKSGTYTLSLAGFGTTANIEWDAAAEGGADSVQALLNVMLAGVVPAINVASVKLKDKGNSDRVYEIEFSRNPNVRLTADSSNLVEVDNPHRELTFAIEFERSFGFGEARVATRQAGGEGLDEVQTVTVNATDSGGALDDEFTLGLRGSSGAAPFFTSGIAYNASAADVEAALESLGVSVGATSGTTTQVVQLKNTAGNASFRLTHSDGRVSDAIAVDADTDTVATALMTEFGTVTVTGGSLVGNQRVYTLVFATDPGETLGTVGQIDGKNVDVDVEKDGQEYEITFRGDFANTNVVALAADSTQLMGAFGFDLGASLGDLANIDTSGSFSPLVNLNAGITFGLDLGPSQELTIVPPVFGPAPTVSVVTSQVGGGGTAEQQIVTVQSANGGTFTLQLGNETVSGIPFNVPADQSGPPPLVQGLKQRLNNALTGVTVDTVVLDATKEGIRTYTITFAMADGDVRELQGISAGLTGAANDGRLVAEANFTVELRNDSFELAGAGTVRDIAERLVQTITVSITPDMSNDSLADLRDDVQGAINAQLAAFGLGFLTDGELSTGARSTSDAALAGTVAPLNELRNDIEFSLIFEQQIVNGTATAPGAGDDSATTLNSGGALFTTKAKVGDIVVRAGETAVVQSIEDDKIVHTAFASGAAWSVGDNFEIRRASDVTGQLRAVDVLDADASATVTGSGTTRTVAIANAGGGSFDLAIDGTGVTIDFDAPAAKVVAASVNATDRSKQIVTVTKAVDGTFTLALDGKTTDPIAHDALATGIGSVSKALEDAGIDFQSVSRAQTDDEVTFTINFETDPGFDLVVDGNLLQGNSVEERLVAAGITGISVSVDSDTSDNIRRYTLTRAAGFITMTTDGSNLEADGLLLNEDGSLRTEEADRTDVTAAGDYEDALQAVVDAALDQLKTVARNNAFEGTEFGDFTVTISSVGNTLTFLVTALEVDGSSLGQTLELRFRNPVQVDAGGGRLALSTPPVLYSTSAVEQGTRIDRSLEIEMPTGFDDAAYQQLGLLTAPTRFSGITTDAIELELIVNDDTVSLSLAAGNYGSIDGLVTALQGALSGASASLITVERVKATGEAKATGNRIQFKGGDTVTSLQINVPATLSGGGDNGAITELGFNAGEGEKKRGKATEFFIEDVDFTGDFYLVAEDLSATATLGFLGIKATGSGTIGDAAVEVSGTTGNQTVLLTNADGGTFTLSDGAKTTGAILYSANASGDSSSVQGKLQAAGFTGVTVTGGGGGPYTITFTAGNEPDALLEAGDDALTTNGLDDKLLEGGFVIELKNPEDGETRLTPADIVGAFQAGRFFFDSEELADTMKTGILDGVLSGEFGVNFGIVPDGFLSGLSDDLNAGIEIRLASPNWLEARPSLTDKLGFGDAQDKDGNAVEGPINFTGATNLFTLGEATPKNGQLTRNLSFMVSNDSGVTEALGVLNVSDTKPGVEVDTTTKGGASQNEVQEIKVLNASGGTFTLKLGDQVTRKLLYDAPATGPGSVKSALEALNGITAVDVAKIGSGGEITYTITFTDPGMVNIDELKGNASELTRGRAELQADLQKAVNLALGELGSGLDNKIRVTLDSDGKIQLAGDAGFRIRQNSIEIDFTGPDFDALLARFKNLGFDDIIFGLQKVVEFLQTLDGSDGGEAQIPALTVDFPLIERSISDLLDPAADFLDFIDEILADPAGSVQKLNVALANVLGFDAPAITSPGAAAVQTLQISNAAGGTFTLALGDEVTAPIFLDLDAPQAELSAAVRDALLALPGVSTVTVTEIDRSQSPSGGVTWQIDFGADPGFGLVGDLGRLVALNILSLDPDDFSNLNIDFGFGVGAQLSRPFSLDLADAFAAVEIPDFLADFVGVDASGTLSLEAGVDLNLAFGIDLTGNDQGIFLRVDDTGVAANVNASGANLDFSAKLGPFGVFVVNGEAGLGGDIFIGLVDNDGDQRLDLVRFGSAVSVEAVETGNLDVQLVTVRSAGSGTFTLKLGATQTGDIEWNAPASGSADSVQQLLAAAGIVATVTSSEAGVYKVTFASTPSALLNADGSNIARSDLGRITDFLPLGALNTPEGIQIDLNGAAVLPLFIGTENDQIPIDFFDGDGTPGDDNFVVATFDVLEVFDNDPQGQEDDGIGVNFATVSPQQSRDVSDADLEAVIKALDVTDADGNAVTVQSVVSNMVGGDKVFTVTFSADAQKLIATSTAGALIVRVEMAGAANSPGKTQEIRIKRFNNAPASGTFRLATPSAVGINFFNDLELPGIFALLSDPAVVIDGLDRVLLTLQDALNGQIMGIDLPFVGDLLADNPAANIIGDFRDDLLKPLANTIRENNLDLDGLIEVIKETLFDVLGPDSLDLLRDRGDDADTIVTVDDIRILFLKDGEIAPVFTATSLQFDFDLGQRVDEMLADIEFDLGIDALGIEVDLTPRLLLDWNLHVGFGVDQSSGFYFVSEIEELVNGDLVPVLDINGDSKKELDLSLKIDFGGEAAQQAGDVKSVNGRLVFLALGFIDGIDVDGDGIRDEFTNLFLNGGVDLADPDGDGRLTFSEMTSASLSDIFRPEISGGAQLRADAMVDFSTIDATLGNVLPKISTDILVDFLIEAAPGSGLTVNPPEVAFLDVTLDLGSFISDFAGPILEAIADVLGPLDFLIGPDGFLNKRIPLLSDLLGKTVTGKDLVVLYDPVRGPQVVAFLDFIDELYFLATLVTDAAREADGDSIMINFGDVVLFDNENAGLDLTLGGAYVDQLFAIGLPDVSDLRDLKDLKGAEVPSARDIPPPSKPTGKKTSSFTKGVTESGSIMFPILQPENVFKLLMGQTTTLVQIELPEFGFDFFYRQLIPIYGPIVGTFAGGISANIDMGFGYDTLGLEQFLVTQNPANLINGFFLSDVDPATGFDRVEAALNLEIAVGAALSLGFITAGVEGGIAADIDFNLSDLNADGKVRLDEMAANIAANFYIPLAVFDISGMFELFLRAFYEINLGLFSIEGEFEFARFTLFEFDIPFIRPSILGVQNGDTLTLNIGPNAEGRLQGDLRDGDEKIFVKTKSDGSVVVWSDQFNVNETIAGINPFVGVKTIIADGGAGNDFLDFSGVNDTSITIEASGGEGNDRIIGGIMAGNVLRGGGGRDTLEGGSYTDELYGDAGNDTLRGGNNPAVPTVRIERVPGETKLQNLTVAGAGRYTLSADGRKTDPILATASANDVLQALIDAQIFESDPDTGVLLNAGDGVTGADGGPYLISFAEAPLLPLKAAGVDTDMLFGGEGNDILDGGPGSDVLDGGLGDDRFVRSGGNDVIDLLNFGSTDFIDGGGGTPVLDFSGKTENLVFFLKQDAILVGYGDQLIDTATILANAIDTSGATEYFTSQAIVADSSGIAQIIGGDFDDIFYVQGTGSAVVLDGFKGNDQYLLFAGPMPMTLGIDDRGNPWNSGDLIEVIGSTGDDDITVTASAITVGAGRVATYVGPPLDSNILQIRVLGDNRDPALGGDENAAGDDTIRVESTNVAVPVRVEAGLGDDVVIVGDGTVDGIAGILRSGLNLGPLVLVGGAGHDTVIIDDSTDDSANTGNATAFLENRRSTDEPVEIGVISGLDMSLQIDGVDKDGRVEFEGFEVIDVRMGTGNDTFTIGGGFNLDLATDDLARGTAEDRQLVDSEFSKGRLTDPADPDALGIVEFTNGITGLTIISGGNEAVTPAADEVQQIEITATTGTFTLTFTDPDTGEEQTTGVLDFDADSDAIEQALVNLTAITPDDISIEKAGLNFTVTFLGALGQRDIAPLVVTPDSAFLGSGTATVASIDGRAGGTEGDVINVIATLDMDSASFDRNDLDSRLGLLGTSTQTEGDPGTDSVVIGDGTNEAQQLTIVAAALEASDAFGASVGYFTLRFEFQETKPIAFDASATDIENALADLSLIGRNSAGDPNVTVTDASAGADRIFDILFVGDKAELDQQQITARVVPLTILGGDGVDQLNVQSIDQTTFFLGGDDDDFVYLNVDVSQVSVAAPELPDPPAALISNGVNASITLDGEGGSDGYFIHLIGGATDSQINVFDTAGSGFAVDTSTDTTFDKLTIFGIDDANNGDLFLLRAGASENALAFIALLNEDGSKPADEQPLERVNYNTKLEQIVVEGLAGDDEFYVDDTRATITIEGGEGDDFFQIGQLYKTARTPALAGVAPEDVFATTETTRGFLSNGISDPMTINAGDGEDEFIVFRNLAVLTLNGGDNNDTFLIQAFALVGSVDDERARTDITGDAGADLIQYAVNAPVQINGGDGLDTVIVIGTEFSDDFVVTEDGVFGAGLNVNFVNIEFLEVDGAEGDDRFFILGTGENFVTKVVGSKGNDTFNVNGPTPENGVISNDLRGHSGIIEHFVASDFDDSVYQTIKVDGISANVADNDEPAIVVSQSDGFSKAYLGSIDDYTIVLTRPPRKDTVRITVTPPKGLVLLQQDPNNPGSFIEVRNQPGDAIGFKLIFDGANWFVPQTVKFRLDTALLAAEADFVLPDLADIEHKVESDDTITGTASAASINGDFIAEEPGLPPSQEARLVDKSGLGPFPTAGSEGLPEGLRGAYVVIANSSDPAAVGQTRLILEVADENTLILDKAWDVIPTDAQYEIKLFSGVQVRNVRVAVSDPAIAAIIVEEIDGIGTDSTADTLVAEGAGDSGADFIQVRLAKPLTAGQSVTVDLQSSLVGSTDVGINGQLRFYNESGDEITSLTFDDTSPFDQFQKVRVDAFDDGVVEGFHNVDMVLEASGGDYDGVLLTLVAGIADNDAPGVRIIESDSSTDVIEFDNVLISLTGASQTQTGTLFNGNVLTFEFDLGGVPVLGDGVLAIAAIADLDALAETLTFDAEGIFSQTLFETGGTQFGLSETTITITEQQLLDLVADDGKITFTVTTSPGVDDFSWFYGIDSALTLNLTLAANISAEDRIALAEAAGFPYIDSYQAVLTEAPQAGETVTVTVDPRATRTSRTGGIATFAEQVEVSLNGIDFFSTVDLNFTAADWNVARTIYVRAIDDARVDGGETKVFAPLLDQVNRIQGPLFIIGGEGTDRTGLLEREPIMLPGEFNQKPSLGQVVTASEVTDDVAAMVTIDPVEAGPDLLAELGVASVDEITPDLFVDKTIEIVDGPGKNKIRIITAAEIVDANTIVLSLSKPWASRFSGDLSVPTSDSSYTIYDTNPNFLANEAEQVDILVVNDTDNINSFDDPALPAGTSNPFAAGRLFYDDSTGFGSTGAELNRYRITGFGMGGDRIIGGGTEDATLQPGGITYEELEIVEVNLGGGNNRLTVDDSISRVDGFQTWTIVNTGAGDDQVTVNLDEFADGRFALNTGGGDDTVDSSGSSLPLIIFGGSGDDTLVGGIGNDIIFGDRGQVDFLDDSGAIVTRLGSTPDQIIGALSEISAGENLLDSTANFPVADADKSADRGLAGLYVVITVGPGVGQQRLITGNSQTELFLDQPWDTGEGTGGMPDANSKYLILTTPEFQTDGIAREPDVLRTIDPDVGGSDTITSIGGANIIFGGTGSDNISGIGATSSETIFGDNGQVTFGGAENFDEGEQSSTLSVNFAGEIRQAGELIGEAGAPGARAGNWNTLERNSPNGFGAGAGEFLYFDDGLIASGIVIQWGRDLDSARSGETQYDTSDNIDSDGDSGADPDLTLFDGYLEVGGRNTLGVNVDGLGNYFSTYDLYVYLDAGDSDSAAGSSVRTISAGSTKYFLNDPDGNTFTGTYIEATSTDPLAPDVGNYVVFRGLTSDRVEVRIESDSNDRQNLPVINGLQIVGQHHEIDRYETTDLLIGGADIIRAGGGADIVFGGAGTDDIETYGSDARGASDADIVVGDNARATFMLGDLRKLRSTDSVIGEGFDVSGDDRIVTGNGEDLVIGGIGNDTIDTGMVEATRDTQIISLNFNSESPKSKITGLAGAAQAGNWNNLTGDRHVTFGDDPDETIVFSDGSTADGVTIEWGNLNKDGRLGKDLQNASHDEIINPDTDNERLFEGYLRTSRDNVLGINISGLNAYYPVYDIYVYLDMKNSDSNPGSSVQGISDGTTMYYLNDASGNTFNGEFVQSDSTDPNAPVTGNYVVFRNLTTDVATIRISGDAAALDAQDRAGVSGVAAIQVVGGTDKDLAVMPQEGVIGGDFDRDTVVGDNAMVRLLNGEIYELRTQQVELGGNDTIIGGEGGDTLIGGSGDDYIGGEGGNDLILGDNIRLAYFAGEVLDFGGDRSSVERLLNQRHQDNDDSGIRGIELMDSNVGGNDTLEGGVDDDLMFGQAGNDIYVFAGGGLGEDTVVEVGDRNGAAALNDSGDTLDFSEFIGEIDLDLADERKEQINRGRFNGDINLSLTIGSATGFENVIGSEFDDKIYGNARDNTIRGLGGDDTIEGRKGVDTLSGDDGNDLIAGGEGNDIIYGDAGDDRLNGDTGDDLLAGGDGDDELDGGYGDDVLDGGPGNDTFRGVKRDTVIDPVEVTLFSNASADVPEQIVLPSIINQNIFQLSDEQGFDAVTPEQPSDATFTIDDLIGLTLGMRYGAAIPTDMNTAVDSRRRPFVAETLGTGRQLTPSAWQVPPSTLVFDEALGEWISIEEADLLSQIDERVSVAAASDNFDVTRDSDTVVDGAGLIDWSSQAGVSHLIGETTI